MVLGSWPKKLTTEGERKLQREVLTLSWQRDKPCNGCTPYDVPVCDMPQECSRLGEMRVGKMVLEDETR